MTFPFVAEFHVLTGDLDGDGVVNFNDTVPLSLHFGATGGAPYSPGDVDGDGDVNFNDTAPFSLNFGATLAALTHDFGDAPESGAFYRTTLANNGARHVISGNTLLLGVARDAESDGQPSPDASGDGSDEDGVDVIAPVERGTNVGVTVTSTGDGFINGWIDFNQDGDWNDPGEQVLTDVPVVAGANNLQISVPAGAVLGNALARFRLTGTEGYSHYGLAPDGEVEDYQINIVDPAPDAAADLGQETPDTATVATLPEMISESDDPADDLPDDDLVMLSPAFTTFDHPLSLFTIHPRSRSARR